MKRLSFAKAVLVAAAASLTSCNQYDLFSVTGFEQEAFSAKADILFVIDNSDSMQEETEALATSFTNFINLLSAEQAGFPTENLSDAVSYYAQFSGKKGSYVNYQLAVTTTDPSENGPVFSGSGAVTRFDDDVGNSFAKNLLCDSTCFVDSPPAGNGRSCGDPLGDRVTQKWLDCECDSNWQGNCGSEQEEHLEAVFLAMCSAVPNPPAACFEHGAHWDAEFRERDVGRNEGFLRDNATFIPVIITDEGDDSRRMEGNDPVPAIYSSLFAQFNRRTVWTVIGPYRNDAGRFPCPTGASQFGTLRLQHFVEATNGLYVPITDEDNNCEPRNFDDALAQLGQLLTNLNRSFRLRSVPIPESITVFTSGGGTIPQAEQSGISDAGVPIYGDGWSYDFPTNTVLLHGSAVPDFGEDVTVYYKPQDGNPRSLPF